MVKGVEKFIKYLEEEKEKITKPPIKLWAVTKDVTKTRFSSWKSKKSDRELEIDFILQRITMSDEEYLKHMEVFHHFKDLSRYIEEANLSSRETFNVVMFMLRRNINCLKRAKKEGAINDTELRNYHFDNISTSEIDHLISTGEINKIINGDDEELTKREREIRDTILAHTDEYCTNIDDMINEHLAIKTHYLDKIDSFNDEDIDIVMDNLRTLAFSDNVCQIVEYVLNRSLTSHFSNEVPEKIESKIEDKSSPYSIKSSTKTPPKVTMPYKERKGIYNKIREYYDIPKKEIIKDVTYKEMLEIVSLMLKIDIDLKTIRSYIRQVLNKLEKVDNPAVKYQMFKSKLAYYLTEEQIAYLDELYDAFQADEGLWMNEFLAYLDEVMNYISETDNYTYELQTAKQLLKSENGN